LSAHQIFSFEQLSNKKSSVDRYFANYLKYFNIDSDTIEFARDVIRNVVPLKHLNKMYSSLGIICSISYVDETDKQHSSEAIWRSSKSWTPQKRVFSINLILIFEHYMSNITLDETIKVISNRTIKLSILISTLLKRIVHENWYILL
jgi:hypothetical protein